MPHGKNMENKAYSRVIFLNLQPNRIAPIIEHVQNARFVLTRWTNVDTHFKRSDNALQENTLPWWYVFVTVGRIFCHACTSMMIWWQNQDSHTCVVVEVFHDISKIIITEVSTSMMINRASQKCFRQGGSTRGIHRNGMPLSTVKLSGPVLDPITR